MTSEKVKSRTKNHFHSYTIAISIGNPLEKFFHQVGTRCSRVVTMVDRTFVSHLVSSCRTSCGSGRSSCCVLDLTNTKHLGRRENSMYSICPGGFNVCVRDGMGREGLLRNFLRNLNFIIAQYYRRLLVGMYSDNNLKYQLIENDEISIFIFAI